MTVEFDWKGEKDKLRDPLNWWKPATGIYRVKFLNDGNPYTVNFKGVDQHKWKLDIEVVTAGIKQQFTWGIVVRETKNSLYGQLCVLGANRGTLKDLEVTLIVRGDGQSRQYIIQEALALMSMGNPEELKINKF